MVAQTQADRIAALGQKGKKVQDLYHFTEALKTDFKSILVDALAAEEGAGDAANLQHAADLCAERCEKKLLEQINGSSTLGDTLVHAFNLPRASRIKKQPKESLKHCTFFDLASGDDFDDDSTSAGSSSSASDNEEEEGSIEFMFGECFLTINFNKDTELPDDNVQLHSSACQLNSTGCVWASARESVDGKLWTAKPAGGRRLSRKDLVSLYQDIKSLREEFEASKAKPVHVASLFAKPTATSDSRFPKSLRA